MVKVPIKKKIAEANGVDTSKKTYTLLVDGSNLIKIAAVDSRLNESGKNYGCVLRFLKMLGEILLKKDFDYCCVCFDAEGSGILRWQLYKDYKANRDKDYAAMFNESDYDRKLREFANAIIRNARDKSENHQEDEQEEFERQKRIISSILEELCVRQYEYKDVEGDDIISYYVKNKLDNEYIVIVSSDKDLTQLINDKVIVYNPRTKGFITEKNAVETIGIRSDNVVVEKILCGDASDNIKGIKGVGETTLLKYIPELKKRKVTIEEVIHRSQELLEERKQSKKKPLKVLENIVNGTTDGCQEDIYKVNRAIIDLSEPLLTDEAMKSLSDEIRAVIDTSDRDIKNVYKIVREEKLNDLMDENRFAETFGAYSRIIKMEKNRFEKFRSNAL